jgi:hypothetical protein
LNILQIVPRLSPSLCGVADYSLDLARQLRRAHRIQTRFLVADPSWSHGTELDGFKVEVLPSRSGAVLESAIAASHSDVVVIQYSGYGFHRRGAPLWLLSGLRRIQQPIVTMFHELFASGRVTSSAFWLSPLMKLIARKLARRSSHIITNRQASAEWLGSQATVLPVFSSLGECSLSIPVEQREDWIALFPYQSGNNTGYWTDLTSIVTTLRPRKLISLGRHSRRLHEVVRSVPIEDRGILPAEEVSKVLQQCRFGYLSYYPDYLGKSAILAAFAAHGLALMFSPNSSRLSDGLEFGRHFVNSKSHELLDPIHQCRCSLALSDWYSTHSLEKTAELYYRILRGVLC